MMASQGKKRKRSETGSSLGAATPGSHAKPNPRISKQDFFAISALWMERSPLGDWRRSKRETTPPTNAPATYGLVEEAHTSEASRNLNDRPDAALEISQQDEEKATDGHISETSQKSHHQSKDLRSYETMIAGVVIVSPNDRIVAMDCTRNGVHAAARVLINFPDKAQGCTVYMSRKPCSYCVKLLVQAEVKKILYLPFKPEASPDPECDPVENASRIENLLKVFPTGMSMHKPEVTEMLQESLASTVKRPDKGSFDSEPFRQHLIETYWSNEWVDYLGSAARLTEVSEEEQGEATSEGSVIDDIIRCPGLDKDVLVELQKSIENLMKWIALATVALIPGGSEFKTHESYEFKPFLPTTENEEFFMEHIKRDVALHLSMLALIAARRTDDPSTGVGVILTVKNEIVAVGLNGYPSKANYGDFPRRKDAKTYGASLKYPYLIHAEQNALLLRNTRDIRDESTTAYVTKTPCDECAGLLVESGVRNVVLPWREEEKEQAGNSKPGIKYDAFFRKIEDSSIRAFYGDVAPRPTRKDARRNLGKNF